jgi:hypothetical protein
VTSAPFWKATSVVTLSPPIWKTGAAVSVTSSARQSIVCMQFALKPKPTQRRAERMTVAARSSAQRGLQ